MLGHQMNLLWNGERLNRAQRRADCECDRFVDGRALFLWRAAAVPLRSCNRDHSKHHKAWENTQHHPFPDADGEAIPTIVRHTNAADLLCVLGFKHVPLQSRTPGNSFLSSI